MVEYGREVARSESPRSYVGSESPRSYVGPDQGVVNARPISHDNFPEIPIVNRARIVQIFEWRFALR